MATIYGQEIAVGINSIVRPDGWRLSGRIVEGDEFCGLRLTTNNGVISSIPVQVVVTGRTFQRVQGYYCVRVSITVPGDGEPETTFGGWLIRD